MLVFLNLDYILLVRPPMLFDLRLFIVPNLTGILSVPFCRLSLILNHLMLVCVITVTFKRYNQEKYFFEIDIIKRNTF